MSFAQLTYRESLRDIEACLRSRSELLYHLGFRGVVARSTLADACMPTSNSVWSWRRRSMPSTRPPSTCA